MRPLAYSRGAPTPLGASVRGLAAGAAGTAAMTAAQTIYYKASGVVPSEIPGRVAKRIIGGVFHRPVDERWTGALNNAMHWSYGTGWGGVYGLIKGSLKAPALSAGAVFGAAVWGVSLLQLPAMQLARPIWEMPPSEVARDLSFHVIYGLTTAGAYAALRG